jgi:hypothetical protein
MNRALSWLAPYEIALPRVFEEYLQEVKELPITSERLRWDRSVLQNKDKELEAMNQQYRDRVFDACWALIDRFAESPSTVNE